MVEARVINPLFDLSFPEIGQLVFKVDTGFSGPVMVTAEVLERLKLTNIEVPEDARPVYSTMTGPIAMRSAPAILSINGKEIETDILTPLYGLGRFLIGFEILRKLNLALLRSKACFIET